MARWLWFVVGALTILAAPPPAGAVDIPIQGYKLVVTDKVVSTGKAKVAFVARDEQATVTTGNGTDPADLAASLQVSYGGTTGLFDMPQGSHWLLSTPEIAKYADATSPATGSVKVTTIRPGKGVKVIAKSLGETPIDVSTMINGPVYAALTVVNGAETFRQCTYFNQCTTKSIADGTGWKLICRNPGLYGNDWTCRATTPTCLASRYEDLGSTVVDTCTNLEWEKKETEPFSGVDASNPHDVDNAYLWAGHCSVSTALCQPSAAAEAACQLQTDSSVWAFGCSQCGGLDGTCVVESDCNVFLPTSITTVWEWLAGLNASAFGGHSDWRLPTSGGPVYLPTGQPRELESLIDPTFGWCADAPCKFGCGVEPCINPVFGPTAPLGGLASATTAEDEPEHVVVLASNSLDISPGWHKNCAVTVRAVRDLVP